MTDSILEAHDGECLNDSPFNKHSMNDSRNRSPLSRGRVDIGLGGIRVRMVQGIDEEAFRRTCSRATLATLGVDLDNPPDDADWEEMLKGGLQTALESQVVVFEVSGVSRTATHQLVRSRRAAFHQQSQRASFMGERPNVRMPMSISGNRKAREAFMRAVEMAEYAYNIACEQNIAYQDARFALLEGTETYIMCEYPLREFLAVYAYRACSMFQWEIMHVVREMGRILAREYPWLEPYIKVSCEKTHKCHFQGWERVEGHCPLPWAREDNRVYLPDPKLRIGG